MYTYNLIRLEFLFLWGLFTCFSIPSADSSGFNQVMADSVSDDRQFINQSNNCGGDSNCNNELLIQDYTISKDGELIASTSNQNATQINNCFNQNCANVGILTNNVFESETLEPGSQDLYQECDTSDGPNCLNTNSLIISGSAVNKAFLDYVASQSIQNNTENANEIESINNIRFYNNNNYNYNFLTNIKSPYLTNRI